MIKYLLLVYVTNIIYTQSDTIVQIPILDLKKGFNIPGLIPQTKINKTEGLLSSQIEDIKNTAKKYIPSPISETDTIVIITNRGKIKLRYYPEIAPKHCMNFKKLANSSFYDNTLFHRSIPNFMIQGGDILSRDIDPENDGLGNPGWSIDAEFNEISHKRGVLSMARGPDPNSAGSQFFICVSDAFHLDNKYTAFGEVIEGMDVIDKIVKSQTNYRLAKNMCKKIIPDGENLDDWITLRDPKGGMLYTKLPKYANRDEYVRDMKKKLRSDAPISPQIMKTVRVISATD
tara:strand:- start:5214 stop:6077 length:864 start_codon:yes stop_codon:yes gene_type:complete